MLCLGSNWHMGACMLYAQYMIQLYQNGDVSYSCVENGVLASGKKWMLLVVMVGLAKCRNRRSKVALDFYTVHSCADVLHTDTRAERKRKPRNKTFRHSTVVQTRARLARNLFIPVFMNLLCSTALACFNGCSSDLGSGIRRTPHCGLWRECQCHFTLVCDRSSTSSGRPNCAAQKFPQEQVSRATSAHKMGDLSRRANQMVGWRDVIKIHMKSTL